MNISTYTVSTFYRSTGSSDTKTYRFLPEHAAEINTTYDRGIPIEAAKKLCVNWNKRHKKNTSIRYHFTPDY